MTNAVNVATTALKTIASAPEAAQSSPHIAQSVEATSDWLASFTALVDKADGYVWGVPLIAAILVTGLILTCVLRLSHIFNLREAFRIMFSGEDAKGADGEVSQFGALCTALSATIGTGNIVGVATAIGTGGPGALFWMEVAAFFGMATKYAEGLLAVKYREITPDGRVLGGPFYYIETGIKERFGWNMKWLAVIFAVFGIGAGLLGIGTITQVNGITSAMARLTPNAPEFINLGGNSVSWTTAIAGILVTIFAATVIIGGLKRIAKVSTYIVPIMAIVYILACVLLLLLNFAQIPQAIQTIVQAAFNPSAITGGAVGTIFIAMQKGIARGIFSNEAGLGSAPIAAAAAKTKEPVRQGFVCMTGTFFDSGLAIVPAGSVIAPFFLAIALVFFAFTTILGWAYYSEKCLQYLMGGKNEKATLIYRWVYIAALFIGPYLTVSAVWTSADIFNGLMAFPNLVALILLSGIVSKETKDYLERLHNGKVGD